ncbi:hypothetical protein D3C78_1832910 [compost metagenome]
MSNVFVRLAGGERTALICDLLRAMSRASGDDACGATNRALQKGHVFHFGGGPLARGFMADVSALLRKSVRRRLTIELRG